MSTYITINITLELTCFLISFSLLISLLVSKAYRTKLARILLGVLTTNSVILLCDAAAWWFALRPEPYIRSILLAVNFLVYALGYVQPVLIAYYLVEYLSVKGGKVANWFVRLLPLSGAAMIALTVLSQFTGWLYSIDENNLFAFGPLGVFSQLYSIVFLAANILLVLVYRRHNQRRETAILLIFLLLPILGTVAELFAEYVMTLYISTTMAFIILYVSIQARQELQAVERENELRTSIMLSQIQPHFLYNSLASIEYLCEREEPKEAGQAVREFSKYLRGNMNSLTYTRPIPFEKELEHVRLYLSLEKRRFGERLQVHFDIQATGFSLPALTLQPIVENAVKYGVTKREEGGAITIAAYEAENDWVITVTDNGMGFDPLAKKEDGRTHIGIENVRHRLEAMSGGTLEVTSTPGVGAVAVLTIPKGGADA